ncbi:MAG TPA: ABC transporter ATP-binding protein [Pirellulaceae bacterium]|nr:ABC transporter ATP-binding protein [Pirellulaceae bacterium]
MGNPQSTNALRLQGVGVRFHHRVVLSNVSLTVATGEKVCLRGPSGCGKSTVLGCLLGFVLPHTGEIEIEGHPLTARSVWTFRQRIAWAPQEPDWTGLTLREALDQPFTYHANRNLRPPTEPPPPWMERFDLPRDLLNTPCSNLSGGEKQRLGLVIALQLHRPILLLDEVTSALDRTNRERVRDVLRALNGPTILAVSHDPEAESWADRIVELEAAHA